MTTRKKGWTTEKEMDVEREKEELPRKSR